MIAFCCGTGFQGKTPFPDNKQQHQAFLPRKNNNKHLYSLHVLTDVMFFAMMCIVIFIIAKHFHLSEFSMFFFFAQISDNNSAT